MQQKEVLIIAIVVLALLVFSSRGQNAQAPASGKAISMFCVNPCLEKIRQMGWIRDDYASSPITPHVWKYANPRNGQDPETPPEYAYVTDCGAAANKPAGLFDCGICRFDIYGGPIEEMACYHVWERPPNEA